MSFGPSFLPCNTHRKDVQNLAEDLAEDLKQDWKQPLHTHRGKRAAALGSIWRCSSLLLVLVGLGCDPPPSPDRLVGQGEVKQLVVHDRRVVIDHGPIPTLFPAKTSSFALRSPALLKQCTPGERVRFTLERGEQTLYLVKIEKLDSPE